MNLVTLSAQNLATTGNALGFVIKSLAHPERKFKVEAKLTSGKFVITRFDNNESYMVLGTEDRYEMAVTAARLTEVKLEVGQLLEQRTIIADRLAELKETYGDVVEIAG